MKTLTERLVLQVLTNNETRGKSLFERTIETESTMPEDELNKIVEGLNTALEDCDTELN